MFNQVPLFEYLNDIELDQLLGISLKKRFPANAIIFNEGDSSDALYIVKKGKAAAVCFDEEGKQIILNLFGPTDYFGEMSFFDGSSRCATIVTREPSEFAIIPRQSFLGIVSSNPTILEQLVKGLLQKIRKATQQIEDLAFLDVYGRVARLLTEKQNQDGIIEEKLTHQYIADIVGASRETVSRIFKELTTQGYVKRQSGRFVFLKELPYKFKRS
ncbi:MAG: cyclic nucleotide-binding domain-containing protein [Desulfobacteraceae bacterium]|nr:cyclic nucleotide-binding domain-containing protein [Desulfobacteraceae bacterium]